MFEEIQKKEIHHRFFISGKREDKQKNKCFLVAHWVNPPPLFSGPTTIKTTYLLCLLPKFVIYYHSPETLTCQICQNYIVDADKESLKQRFGAVKKTYFHIGQLIIRNFLININITSESIPFLDEILNK